MSVRSNTRSFIRCRTVTPVQCLVCLVAAFMLPSFIAGCRQTTTTTTGALQPLTTPNGSIPAPSLVPFTGQGTRVSPPATGSAGGVPNNYMGGAPTVGSTYGAAPSGFAATGGQPIGSGVATPPAAGGANSVASAAVDLTPPVLGAGAMPAIDLTHAPPPPGYRPSTVNTASGIVPVSHQSPNGYAPIGSDAMPAMTLQPMAAQPQLNPIGTAAAAPMNGAAPMNNGVPMNQPASGNWNGAAAPATGPSAMPPSTAPSADGLQWRSPAAGY
ncbi:hypothetical protein [Crateriforma conspicua]|nr:hypothetical protein [Crateriforma conspicua]